ncbi:MAG: hypothetical protein XE02_0297, partial [Mesotoga infera]
MRSACIIIIMVLLSTAAMAIDSKTEETSGNIERITVSQVTYSEEAGSPKPQKREIKRIEVFSEQGLPVITALHTNGKEYSRVEYTYDTESRSLMNWKVGRYSESEQINSVRFSQRPNSFLTKTVEFWKNRFLMEATSS